MSRRGEAAATSLKASLMESILIDRIISINLFLQASLAHIACTCRINRVR
jgi:hypothetical protein